MTHCRCCDMPLFHPISIQRALCTTCFMAMDARLLKVWAEKEAELEKLEAWAKLDGSHVKEGAIYR